MNGNRYCLFEQLFPFFVVWKMYGKSKEIYGKCMEMTKDLTKIVKIYENVWKCIGKSMEMHGNVLKIYGKADANLWKCNDM